MTFATASARPSPSPPWRPREGLIAARSGSQQHRSATASCSIGDLRALGVHPSVLLGIGFCGERFLVGGSRLLTYPHPRRAVFGPNGPKGLIICRWCFALL